MPTSRGYRSPRRPAAGAWALEEVAQSDTYAERVGWLRCFRGIDTVTAMTLLAA